MTLPLIFQSLSEEQFDTLKDALPLITILIAGADGTIDEQELNWAEKLTNIRTYTKPEELNEFYLEVEKNLENNIQRFLNEFPENISEREDLITKRLAELNKIFNCLSNDIAHQLYESFTSFARHIAKASGGFLRFGSISTKEKRWIDLPMIDTVILEIPEEPEE